MTYSTDTTRSASMAWLVGCALATALVWLPRAAHAQACCTATGAGEFAVVGRCQQAVVGAQMSVKRGIGTYTDEGAYHGLEHAEMDDVTMSVGGGFRPFSPKWQLYGSVPLRLQYRAFDAAGSDTSVGLGDAAVGLRWTALEDEMRGPSFGDWSTLVPFVDLYATVKAPTGRAPEQTETTTGADITGDGAWQVTGGAKISKFLNPRHVVGLGVSYAYGFERTIEKASGQTTRYAPGSTLNLQVRYLHIPNLFWSWGLNSSLEVDARARADGAEVPYSQTRRLRFGAHLTHALDFPKWEATVAVSMDSWWDGAAANLPFVGPSASLAIRRQWL